jgi:hypothetical protein
MRGHVSYWGIAQAAFRPGLAALLGEWRSSERVASRPATSPYPPVSMAHVMTVEAAISSSRNLSSTKIFPYAAVCERHTAFRGLNG